MINIGAILLAWGIVDKPQLEAAVAAQARGEPRKKLGELVVGLGYATPAQLQTALDKQEALRSGTAGVEDIETVAEYASTTTRNTADELELLRSELSGGAPRPGGKR